MTKVDNSTSGLALPLPWHETLWADLNKAIEQDRMPHALLISGPSGIGKERLATALLSWRRAEGGEAFWIRLLHTQHVYPAK